MKNFPARCDLALLRIFLRISALVFFTVASMVIGPGARAQSALDGFDPMPDGPVYAVVVQPDGKILVGGAFTHVLGAARNYIARLNPDGTLDTAFNPNASDVVYALALQPDGKILVGGRFEGAFSIGGQTRNHIARLNPTTGAADSFNPNAGPSGVGGSPGTVWCIAVQTDGKVLIGGAFTSVSGQARNKIARLDPNTGFADVFNPNPHSSGANEQSTMVLAITMQRDGKILAGGFFETIGGQARNSFARLDPATGSSDSFNANIDAHSYVYAIALQADGRIWVGGFFYNIGGQARPYIGRLDPVTAFVDSPDLDPNSYVSAITVQPDGKILVGGRFYGSNSIGGQSRNIVARLDPITGLVDSFDPNVNQAGCCPAPLHAIAVQADGKVLIGGEFTALSPNGGPQVSRFCLARIEQNGLLDKTMAPSINGNVNATALQPDGKIVIGGGFEYVAGVERHGIARLNTDGSLDLAFDPNPNASVLSVAMQPDGKILVAGGFTTVAGQQRNGIARLDATTGLADSFNPNSNTGVSSMAVQSDGKILVGGTFTTIGGAQRYHLARLDGKTGLADSFDPNPTDSVGILAVQADGKIWIGGGFSGVGGEQRRYLARLDPTTGLPDSFIPNLNGAVTGVVVQADGNVVASGSFTSADGQPRNHVARLDGMTGVSDSFDPNVDASVVSMAMQANEKILVGGGFNAIGNLVRRSIGRIDPVTGLADSYDPTLSTVSSIAISSDGKALAGVSGVHYGLIRVSNDEAALQELSATRTAVTWMRGGSSAQFERTTFEYSTDNLNYTLLGSGERAGSNWILTGLNLPTDQNLYVRALGYCRSGKTNGCESLIESIRNVFLREVSVANVVSRKVHGPTGFFDINLPGTGNPGIECRSGGGSGDYQLVFSFANPLTSVGDASLTSGTGTVSSRLIDSNDAHTYIVNLTGVGSAQTINVTLTNVNDSAGNSSSSVTVPMSMLLGDVDGNGIVNATDVAQTKANSGQMIDTANFRDDATANGSVNASDVALVKSCSGTGIPVDSGRLSVSKHR